NAPETAPLCRLNHREPPYEYSAPTVGFSELPSSRSWLLHDRSRSGTAQRRQLGLDGEGLGRDALGLGVGEVLHGRRHLRLVAPELVDHSHRRRPRLRRAPRALPYIYTLRGLGDVAPPGG